jgi:hypothetical protein
MAKTPEQLTEEIRIRAESDPVFLQRLIVDAQRAGEEVNGEPLPANTIVRIAVKGTTLPPYPTGTRIVVWLPNPDVELTDAELEAAAGGGKVDSANGACANAYCP